MRPRRALFLIVGVAGVAAAVVLLTSGGSDRAMGTVQEQGDTTTKAAVVGALEGTGFRIRYRKVPRLEGYEIVSGEATQGSGCVQFTVEIRLGGPFADAARGEAEDPQPPILRYGAREGGTTVGNVIYKTVESAPRRAGKGIELQPDRSETKMAVQVGVALRQLFAPRYRPVG